MRVCFWKGYPSIHTLFGLSPLRAMVDPVVKPEYNTLHRVISYEYWYFGQSLSCNGAQRKSPQHHRYPLNSSGDQEYLQRVCG
ncbi:unnamed protein product [Tuber melanosporum]|uniref:(Perigord truffle) hypothetical protein n=1 Tax=Tuber melanosporum (strain Mel28) TaxID=656061 RepID=D5GEP4_TUBMM|nr:uncharacterized protein GSTUM_00001305001 [Tuber melanosporum]CAZ82987.1 unnamed protein product [Tuber melanosporum]